MMMTSADRRLPATPVAVARARRFVATMLSRWHCDEVAEEARLLTSEVVSDAVRQAPSEVCIHIEADDDLVRVEVSDDPGLLFSPDHGAFERRTGRHVVRSLATRWGSDLDRHRTTTWFELDRHATPANA
jgi:anti-sigma regulatory factor (Ser/Thr protein kinase)